MFQHTAARRRLVAYTRPPDIGSRVSTHSRPKVAGHSVSHSHSPDARFNTQPPEGGWPLRVRSNRHILRFNTQPPEGGWLFIRKDSYGFCGFNTQPPEGGWDGLDTDMPKHGVSTHSRPKAAGHQRVKVGLRFVRFNTQPPEGGWA